MTLSSLYLPLLQDGTPAPVGSEFNHVLVGDFTGDGRHDLVSRGVAIDSAMPSQLYIYEQSMAGMLLPPVRYALDDSWPLTGLSAGDLNGDGILDIVVSHMQRIEIALSSQEGSMRFVDWGGDSVSDKLYHDVAAVAVDVDNDGSLDVVAHLKVTHEGGSDATIDRRSRFRVYYGDGDGGVREIVDQGHFGGDRHDWGDYDSESATAFVARDVNGDGLVDLTMMSSRFVFAEQTNPRYLSIFVNDGNGAFLDTAPYVISLVQEGGEFVAIGDFNDDGRSDLVLTHDWTRVPLLVFHQNENGTFPAGRTYSRETGNASVAVITADLDRDGDDDIVIGNSGWGTVTHHLQAQRVLGNGVQTSFGGVPGVLNPGGISPWGVGAGDLNGDGCTDVAVAAGYQGLQVFHGWNCFPKYVTGGNNPARRR